MINQPPADGSNMPRQMVSRVELVGPRQPTPYDKALCAKARGDALKKQREALGASMVMKTGASHPGRGKTS
ncbi:MULTISPECIES: hypothetical protein [unclassified Afipia]|uniref:hypothetical protein n=1 Tax=unclassified Afipia TaxID=2642050 RepID=UPI00046690C8|nr:MULTISPECIES: hypothetical protein [unclassified Afipia]MAH69098.1 hypothetical protein [Afipia sp.]OUX61646.1 MAG: hypothetical protein CBB64_07625 [Afipia sp. TMED4]HAO42707.1 hypothetical protein [Afipia sp.]HAP09796.1 hypothetical protein [Afipia sp.]HCX19571.1 hypothetical protein [Afipia sp.]